MLLVIVDVTLFCSVLYVVKIFTSINKIELDLDMVEVTSLPDLYVKRHLLNKLYS